jgi:hypothetical protein
MVDLGHVEIVLESQDVREAQLRELVREALRTLSEMAGTSRPRFSDSDLKLLAIVRELSPNPAVPARGAAFWVEVARKWAGTESPPARGSGSPEALRVRFRRIRNRWQRAVPGTVVLLADHDKWMGPYPGGGTA